MMSLSMPRLRYDRIIWVLFLLIVGVIWLRAVRSRKHADILRMEVNVAPLEGGSKMITENEVGNLLHKSFGSALENTQMDALEIGRMEQKIEEDPFVSNADVFIDQKNQLRINIEQRNPVLRVMDINGGNYYLDIDGKKMPVSDNFTARVLVATGKLPPHTPDFLQRRSNALKDVFNVSQQILKDPFLSTFIQQVHVSGNGDIMLSPLIGDQIIILGSARKLEDKLNRLKIFYQQGMPYEGWRKYATINLKYSGQVVCKRK